MAYELSPEQKKYLPLFDLVADKEDWKNPIDTLVDPETLAKMGATQKELVDAIVFYTGSVASITVEGLCLRVKATGYYVTIGS